MDYFADIFFNDEIFVIFGKRVFKLGNLEASVFQFPLFPLFFIRIKGEAFYFGIEPFPADETSLSIIDRIQLLLDDNESRDGV